MIYDRMVEYFSAKGKPEFIQQIEKLKVQKGDILFSENEENKGVYVVVSGLIKQFVLGNEQRESIFKFCGPGDVFGHRTLFSDEPHMDNATCLIEGRLLFFPKALADQLLQSDPSIMKDFINRLSEDSIQQILHSQLLGQYNLRQRTAFGLLYLLSKNVEGNHSEIFLGRDDFANYIGAEKESVVRVMHQFKEDKLIESSGKRIRILKPDLLRKFIDRSAIKKAPLI